MINKYLDIVVFIGSFIFAVILGFIFIPILKKLKFGKTVRDDGPATHLVKNGIPTMGGIIFLIPILVISVVIYLTTSFKEILPLAFVTVGFGFIGFLDDYIQIIRKSKDGLTPNQKMAGLLVISVIFSLYVYKFTDIGSIIDINFFGLTWSFDMKFMFIPFTIFVLLAMTNGVNLTDGVDGLAGGVTFIVFLFFAVVNRLGASFNIITLFAMIAAGSILGFLAFNLYPAKVIMGDTGSLALGGAVASCAILMRMPQLLLIVGIIYVLESLSVIIQVAYFKRTKKRIFKMAPIHHHFEQCGWKETKVTRVFYGITLLMCIIAYLSLKLV